MFFYMLLCCSIFKVRKYTNYIFAKFWIMDMDLFNMLRFIFVIIWGILEIFRTMNGYEGNIKEQVSEHIIRYLKVP